MSEKEYEEVTAAAAATPSIAESSHLNTVRPNVTPTQGCIESSMQDAENSRGARLDHEEEGGTQMKHEDTEMDSEDSSKNQDEDGVMYDMFAGTIHESYEAECRTRMSSEVNGLTREILHLAAKMGVDPRDYAPRLGQTWSDSLRWANGEGVEEASSQSVDVSESLATEELMEMNENGPGSVSEKRQKPTVAEIYSPPRITALFPGYGLYPGVAMNITTNDETGQPWDFDDPRQRQRARDRLRADQPLVLVGSPMCTPFFCRLQSINYAKMHPDRVRAILFKARMHLNFVCSLYEDQVRGGRIFIHEHPAAATSWDEPAVKRVMKLPEVRVSHVDACQYGMVGEFRA